MATNPVATGGGTDVCPCIRPKMEGVAGHSVEGGYFPSGEIMQ
jgi:hypothetical protein